MIVIPSLQPSAVDPHQYCQQKAAASGSSFYYSFLFLPEDRRRAITALYAFCREVDDVVDETKDIGVARTKLAWWREEVHKIYHGRPQHPVARALAQVVGPYHLDQAHLQEIIDGMAMDLEYNAYPDFDALKSIAAKSRRVGIFRAVLGTRIRTWKIRRRPSRLPAHEYARDVGEAAAAIAFTCRAQMAQHGFTSDDIARGREAPITH